jgi:hypothetical protein
MTANKPRSATAAPSHEDTPGRQEPAYEVGRNRPPKDTRFKPGVSGNPGGRKKGSRNLKTHFMEVMESEITVTEAGQKASVPVGKALVLRLLKAAMGGDIRAINSMLDRYERYCPDEAANDDEVAAEDRALLLGTLRRLEASGALREKADGALQSEADATDQEHDDDPA